MDLQSVIITAAVFLAGAGLGFLLGYVLRRGDNSGLAEAELENYKRDVTEHFDQSAQHFQAIGSEYRKLYEHMAAGSEKLCDPVETDDALKFPRPVDVAIEAQAGPENGTDEHAPDTKMRKESGETPENEIPDLSTEQLQNSQKP